MNLLIKLKNKEEIYLFLVINILLTYYKFITYKIIYIIEY